MKKLRNMIRSHEWWDSKLPSVLGIAYASVLLTGSSMYASAGTFLLIVVSLITLGVYAAFINDLTDMEIDARCGKSNFMQKLRPRWRWPVALAPLFIVPGVIYLMYPDWLSVFFYLMIGFSISLYSFPPVRLKNRGLWGVVSCAMAEQMFPALFCASLLFYTAAVPAPPVLLLSLAGFSLLYGVRCILWHQFLDRDNDIRSGIRTFATTVHPADFRGAESVLFIAEAIFLTVFLTTLAEPVPLLAIPVYLLLVFFRNKRYSIGIFIIQAKQKEFNQMILNDYYQFFLPLSMLLTAAFGQPYGWVILAAHLLLFAGQTVAMCKELLLLAQALLARVRRRGKHAG